MERARVVVIGGGITGTSVAYHLAKAGWADVLVLEKGELTSGSTCHAAGLVTQFNPSPTMMRFRRYSVELYRELGVFETVGSLRIASSAESLKELQRGWGIEERGRVRQRVQSPPLEPPILLRTGDLQRLSRIGRRFPQVPAEHQELPESDERRRLQTRLCVNYLKRELKSLLPFGQVAAQQPEQP